MKNKNIDILVNELLSCKTKKELCSWLDELDLRVESGDIMVGPNDWVVLLHAFVKWKGDNKA